MAAPVYLDPMRDSKDSTTALSNGRPILAIPGPSVIPERVLNAMHQAAPNIYTGAFCDTVPVIADDLRAVARTSGQVAQYIANGHGVWEAALSNVLSRGDTVLVLATGRFAQGWGAMAAMLGADVEEIDFGRRDTIDLARVEERLRADKGHRIRAVMAVQVDTASSVRNDVAALRATLDAAGHPALLMIDCIACLGCDRFEMDAWGVDVMVTGSQKGLMTPPGMGFVFYNAKADSARDRADCVTHYWDWRPRSEPDEFYQYFDGTAPTHHLFGLRAALDMILEEGLENVWARHEILARALWAAFEHWGQGDSPVALNIADPRLRSHAVTAVRCGAPQGAELRAWCEHQAGVTLGIGLGMQTAEDPGAAGFFRIGHMGHLNAHMLLGTLGVIEAGLKAVGIPHSPGGVQAAAEVIAAP